MQILRVVSKFIENSICGVMVSMLALSVVGCRYEPRSGKTKDYKFGVCYFSVEQATFC